MGAVEDLGIERRSIPTSEEIWSLHERHLHSLIDAINKCPADHRGPHIGIIMHTLLLGLPQDERQKALEYVQLVLKRELN